MDLDQKREKYKYNETITPLAVTARADKFFLRVINAYGENKKMIIKSTKFK